MVSFGSLLKSKEQASEVAPSAGSASKLAGLKGALVSGRSGASRKLAKVRARSCFVLMIGDEGGILTYLEKGKVVRRIYAASTESQNLKPVIDLLQAHPKAPVYILCDLVDQSYVRHTLPPVSSFSISKLVKRRLDRDFAPEDIKGSIAMGRESEGRKEWVYLLISLANSHALQQWIEPILQMRNHFAGLYLLPVEAQQFVKNLVQASGAAESGLDSEWKILVLHDKVGGFRQVVFQDGKLVFTRLTQLPADTSHEVAAGNVEQEVQNTIEYLRRMSFDEDAGLDVFIVIAQPIRDLIEPNKIGATQVKTFSPFDIAKLLQLEQAALSGDRFADVVFSANFALRQKPQLRLSSALAKKLERLVLAHRGVKAALAVAALVMLGKTALALSDWWQAAGEQNELKTQLGRAQTELSGVQQRYDALGDDQEKVMRISQLYKLIDKLTFEPMEFVTGVTKISNQNVRILSWSWDAKPAPKAPRGRRQKSDAPKHHYQMSARAEFLEHNGDRRLLSSQVKSFTRQLEAAFPAYSVSRTQLPEELRAAQVDTGLVLDLNAPVSDEDYEVKSGEEFIQYTLSYPKQEDKK